MKMLIRSRVGKLQMFQKDAENIRRRRIRAVNLMHNKYLETIQLMHGIALTM